MVLVRIVFHGKLGHAGHIVESMKKGMDAMRNVPAPQPRHVRILTDLSGQFDTVIEELEFDNLDQFLSGQEKMFADPQWQATMRDFADHIEGGSKEYFTVEYTM